MPGCRAATAFGVLPTWARTGFSSPEPRLPHVVGRRNEIAALLFGYPLASPPAADRNNKILWVSRRLPAHPTALWIRAQRMTGARAVGRPVTRVVRGGPGPSIVNLPAAGCWRLRLAWAGRTDTLDLRYRSGDSRPRSSAGRGPKMRRSRSAISTSLMLASRRRIRPWSSNSQSSLP